MRGHIIALINVTNPEQYEQYAKRAAPASAKHGGKYLVRGGTKHPLEGDIPFQRIVVAEFASVEAAKDVLPLARVPRGAQAPAGRRRLPHGDRRRRELEPKGAARPPSTCTEGDPR